MRPLLPPASVGPPSLCDTCISRKGATDPVCEVNAPAAERLRRGERVYVCGDFRSRNGRRALTEG